MTNPLLQMPVKKALITMAAPAAVGMLMTFLFQLVDSYFIGQLGSAELAAISFSYPIYFFLVSFFMGTAIAVSAKVAQALGSQDEHKAQGLTSLSLVFFMLLLALVGSLAYAFESISIDSIFVLLGAKTEMLSLIGEYMLPLYLGLFLLLGTLVANSALMAKGIMVKSTLVMALGGVINLLLDYLLIFGFSLSSYQLQPMGLAGAAWATVISWAVMLVLMFALLVHQQLFKLSALMLTTAKSWSQAGHWFKDVYSLALPAIAAQILAPIAIAVVTRFVAMTGSESQGSEAAVAAYGLVIRIESLGLVGILALAVIMTPFIAQNYGALNRDAITEDEHTSKSSDKRQMQRLDQAIAYAGRMTVYWGLIFYVLMLFLIEPLISLFTDNAEIIQHSKNYFYIVGISLPAFGLLLITTSFFNGVQQGNRSLQLTLVKSLLLTIPLAVAGFYIADAMGIWFGIAIANIIGAVYAGRLLNNWLIKNDSALVDEKVGHKIWQDYLSDLKSLKRFFRF